MTTILQPPTLEHDTSMANRFGTVVCPRGRIERRLVWSLLHHLNAAGFSIQSINDGEDDEELAGTDAERNLAAMNLIFNLDECYCWFQKPGFKQHYVFIVLGNDGWDAVADNSYSEGDADGFGVAMDAFDGEAFA